MKIDLIEFGKLIKQIREKSGENITSASKTIGVDRSYLSKIESGNEKTSLPVFNRLISHYSISKEVTLLLASLIGYEGGQGVVMFDNSQREVKNKMDEKKVNIKDEFKDQQQGVNVNLSVDRVPILYTDSVFISSNNYGIVMNVAQSVDNKNQQIVARVGMSRDHAKALAEVLAKHLAMTMPDKNRQ